MAGDQRRFKTAMMYADRFSGHGKWREAINAYRYALAEFPNNAAAIIGFGRAVLASGQIDIARKAFMQALKINPTNLDALNAMADIQERSGQLDAAAETYLRMGNVHSSRSDLDTAIDYWMRATKLTSGHTSAHRKLADALAQQGKDRLAAREYLTLAALYQKQDDMRQVNKFIDAARDLLPKDPGIRMAIEAAETGQAIDPGWISDTPSEAEEIGEFDKTEFSEKELDDWDDLFNPPEDDSQHPSGGLLKSARQDVLEKLASLIFEDDDNPNAMPIMQAIDFQSRGELQEAANLYHQVIDQGGDYPALFFNLGLLYRDQGQLSEAAVNLKIAAADHHYTASANFALGDTYAATNDLQEAVHYFVEALGTIDMQTVSGHRSYDLAQTYENYADVFLAHNDPEKIRLFIASVQNFFAVPDWEKKVYEARMRMNSLADEENTMSLAEFLETPETEVMVTTLAITSDYLRQNFIMTASEECLRAIQKVPSFLPLHARMADILLKQDRTDDAITKYLYIAKVYQMRKQPDQAINTYLKILKLAPMDVTVRLKLINLYTTSGNIQEALNQYLVLANSYYQLAQVDRAIEKYNETIHLAESLGNEGLRWRVESLTRIADIYNQRFDWSRATSALEQLQEIEPGGEQAKRQLVELYFKQNRTAEAAKMLDELLATYQRQNPVEALELLKDLVSYYPDDMGLRQRLAVAYVQNNMINEAVTEYDSLGEKQLEMGLRDQAIQTIQAIINLQPEGVEGYRRLLGQIGGDLT